MTFVKATPYARKIARQYHIDLTAVTPSGPGGAVLERDVIRAREGREKSREVPVTPLAERMARELHIDLNTVKGTGIGGKISKADIIAASGQRSAELQPGELREAMSPMRRAIAAAMADSLAIPSVTVTTKVDVTRMEELRASVNSGGKIHLTVNDLVLAACARALKKNRKMLCSFAGDSIIYKTSINIGMVVSLPEGILVPVIRDADTLALPELADAAHDLSRRARNHRLTPSECEGSTFSVTNMGMYGVEAFTPVIHSTNAAILGVCSIYGGVSQKDGRIEARKLLHICLTFDHRLLDGADAAKFNLSVREYLENPESLIP